MKFYDVNVSLGGYPFRHIPRHTAAEVREDLEKMGCMGALAVNNGSLLYADTRQANLELVEMIADHTGFFYGCATVNPTWPKAEEELDEFVDEYGFKALRLLPMFHKYQLMEAEKLVRHAASRKIPVLIPQEIVDYRQQTLWEPREQLPYDDMLELAKAVPEATIIWLFGGFDDQAPANVYGEYDRFNPEHHARMLYGSNMPLRMAAPYAKLETDPCGDELRKIVAEDNFRKLILQ